MSVGCSGVGSSAILVCPLLLPSICYTAELEGGGLGLSVGLAPLVDSQVVLGFRSCPHAPAGLSHGQCVVPEHCARGVSALRIPVPIGIGM